MNCYQCGGKIVKPVEVILRSTGYSSSSQKPVTVCSDICKENAQLGAEG
jgi:hypothetical protein